MEYNSIDIKKQVSKDKAEVVVIDGVKRLKDPSGAILQKPYIHYTNAVDHITNAIRGTCPELKDYVNRLFPIFTFKFSTFATGYGYIFMNPYFLDALMKKSKEKYGSEYKLPLFVYMHEIYHNLFSHMADGKRNENEYPDHTRQNIAMDYTINGVIEALYGLTGATSAVGGYINSAYNNKDWTWVYRDIEDKDLDVSRQPYQKIVDAMSNVSKEKPQGGGVNIPQNNEYSFSDDYKEGYQSRYLEIKNIIEKAVKAGKGIEEIITILEDEAQKKGINVYESYLPYPSQNESYNKGVRQAYVDSINKLKNILDNTGDSEDQEYQGRGDNKYNDKLKNAVDDLYKQLSSGTPSKPENQDADEEQNNSDGNSDEQNDSESGDNSEMSGEGETSKNPDDMSSSEKERIMSRILDERHMDKQKETKTETQIGEDFKKHIENLPTNNEMAEQMKRSLKKELDKKFPIAKVKTGIDWKEILEEFITRCAEEQVSTPNINAVAKTIDYYKSNRIIDNRYKTDEADGMNHIVIGLDNSGSVCSSDSVPDFLGALVEIFDNALPDDVVVDFIQFDSEIRKCTRVVHKNGDSIEEISKVSDATGGGTDYVEVMKESELLVMDWDVDEPKLGNIGIFDEFEDRTAEGSDGEFDIYPAMCSIIFTDTDFYYGGKFEDMNEDMYDKMKIVILTDNDEITKTRNIEKYDTIFINRNVWEYGDKRLSESLLDAIQREVDDTVSIDWEDDNKDDGDDVTFVDILNDELRQKYPNAKAEYRDGDIWVIGDIASDNKSMYLNKYCFDGNMKIRGFQMDELNWLPKKISPSSTILFIDDGNYITESDIDLLREKYNNNNIILFNGINTEEYIGRYPSLVLGELTRRYRGDFGADITSCYYFINKDGKKKRVDVKIKKDSPDTFPYININEYFTHLYINIKSDKSLDCNMSNDLYNLLHDYGNYVCINLCESNLGIKNKEITDRFIEGLPKTMGNLKKVTFMRCYDKDGLIDRYQAEHSQRGNIGTNKNFRVLKVE